MKVGEDGVRGAELKELRVARDQSLSDRRPPRRRLARKLARHPRVPLQGEHRVVPGVELASPARRADDACRRRVEEHRAAEGVPAELRPVLVRVVVLGVRPVEVAQVVRDDAVAEGGRIAMVARYTSSGSSRRSKLPRPSVRFGVLYPLRAEGGRRLRPRQLPKSCSLGAIRGLSYDIWPYTTGPDRPEQHGRDGMMRIAVVFTVVRREAAALDRHVLAEHVVHVLAERVSASACETSMK